MYGCGPKHWRSQALKDRPGRTTERFQRPVSKSSEAACNPVPKERHNLAQGVSPAWKWERHEARRDERASCKQLLQGWARGGKGNRPVGMVEAGE
jgi:hypothetical protein